ncbi:MAG TPA: hypothetical protein DCZ95_01460 [Verrucomicrobia bacterium]|nr:MAG: hypothetical protein A2X46_08820 [Lentisphaerae bacterium GWF2_57_35]HBA82736.1 hypothetical protein [Verrucomicrobiota bacterium]
MIQNEIKKRVVVLGGGIGGLAAAYFLARLGRYDVTLIEKASCVGGLCGSFQHQGFTLDYGAHKLYSVIPGILDEVQSLMGDRLLRVAKKNRIFLRGQLLDYPLRLGNFAQAMGLGLFAKLGADYGVEILRGLFPRSAARSYAEYITRRFGSTAYRLVFEPLADKVWGRPDELHPEMARTRVPASGGWEIILKLLGLKKETQETNAEFFYYPRDGFGALGESLKKGIEQSGGKVLLNTSPTSILHEVDRAAHVMVNDGGAEHILPCDLLISSIPVPEICRLVIGETDPELTKVVHALEYRHLVMVYVFIRQPKVLEDQWIFFPERKFIFSRIFEQKQMNPDLGPIDQTVLCCDFTCDADSWQWQASEADLARHCIEGLVNAGFIQSTDVMDTLVERRESFYPRYDLQYTDKMCSISQALQKTTNLLLTGRVGMYNYNNVDHCLDMGRFISQKLMQGLSAGEVWRELDQRVGQYKIVD